MAISEITRQAIIDELTLQKLWWGGRHDDVAFLSRLYRLDRLPSTDRRYSDAAGDIRQHRVNNLDWDDDWVFSDPRFELASDDEKFLQFLAATVHPAVRLDQEETGRLVELYNRHLAPDGYELAAEAHLSETGKRLKVTPADVRNDAKGAESIRRVLGSLGGIVGGIAELRNDYGTGHGKAAGSGGLGPRHARLAVGAASTLAAFLFETYEQRSN